MNNLQSQEYSQHRRRSVNNTTVIIILVFSHMIFTSEQLRGESCPLTLTSAQTLQSF